MRLLHAFLIRFIILLSFARDAHIHTISPGDNEVRATESAKWNIVFSADDTKSLPLCPLVCQRIVSFHWAHIARRHFARTFYAREPSTLPAWCRLCIHWFWIFGNMNTEWSVAIVKCLYMSEFIFFLFRMYRPIRHRHSFFCFAFPLCLLLRNGVRWSVIVSDREAR